MIERPRPCLFFAVSLMGFIINIDLASTPFARPCKGQSIGDDFSPIFKSAGEEYRIPSYLLKAIGYAESRWNQHTGIPSIDGRYGVMGLLHGWSLEIASHLTAVSEERLKESPFDTIFGGEADMAYLVEEIAGSLSYPEIKPEEVPYSFEVLKGYSGIDDESVAGEYAILILLSLKERIFERNISGEMIMVEPRPIDLSLIPPSTIEWGARPDYSGASWVPASSCNYSNYSRGYGDIFYIIIHGAEGSYSATLSWFKSCSASACTHYVIRRSDGAITQMV